MKKFVIPLVTVGIVAALLLGCMPTPAPSPAPPEAPPIAPPEAPPIAPPEAPPEAPPAVPAGPYDPALDPLLAPVGEVDWLPATDWDLPLPQGPYGGLAVKPDGTPFKFAVGTYMENEWCQNAAGLIQTYLDIAGAEYTFFGQPFDLSQVMAWYEDVTAAGWADATISEVIFEYELVPVVERAAAAGIDIYDFDLVTMTPAVTAAVWHNFDGPYGSNVIGQYYVDRAEREDRTFNIYEVWIMRAMVSSQRRHAGFRRPVDQCDRITVMESPDAFSTDAATYDAVMDAFTAHPELDAIFIHGAGINGAVEALRTIGRLYPVDHPDHVVLAINDSETGSEVNMRDGYLDAFGTHGCRDLADEVVKLALLHLVLGQPVPKLTDVPMKVVTTDNIDTIKVLGGTPVWSMLPKADWARWPVLDSTELGILTPTVNMRMELLGY